MSEHDIYGAIAQHCRAVGGHDVTADMIQYIHEAACDGAAIPHGAIGAFAYGQLRDAGLLDPEADREEEK